MNRDFLEMIKPRRSTRSFKPDSIPEDLLDAVLEAGTYAPTGMTRQSPIIIAVSDKKYREKLSKLNAAIMGVDKDPYYGAPTVVLVLADPSANTFVEDGSCVLENLMLAAHACDLGSFTGSARYSTAKRAKSYCASGICPKPCAESAR